MSQHLGKEHLMRQGGVCGGERHGRGGSLLRDRCSSRRSPGGFGSSPDELLARRAKVGHVPGGTDVDGHVEPFSHY